MCITWSMCGLAIHCQIVFHLIKVDEPLKDTNHMQVNPTTIKKKYKLLNISSLGKLGKGSNSLGVVMVEHRWMGGWMDDNAYFENN